MSRFYCASRGTHLWLRAELWLGLWQAMVWPVAGSGRLWLACEAWLWQAVAEKKLWILAKKLWLLTVTGCDWLWLGGKLWLNFDCALWLRTVRSKRVTWRLHSA